MTGLLGSSRVKTARKKLVKLTTGGAEISETDGSGSIHRQALFSIAADSSPDSGRCQLGGTSRAKACRKV
jgi:hypothetical protein